MRGLSEDAIVDDILARGWPAHPAVALGIGDDCALLRPRAGWETAISTDLLLEGKHFRLTTASPEDIGWKAAAVNLSDLAAMGAEPVAFFLSAAFPKDAAPLFGRVLEGLRQCLERFHVPLAGGDLSCADSWLLAGTVVGEVPAGKALRRDGARPGDLVAVSGHPGLAGRGLRLQEGEPAPGKDGRLEARCREKIRRPEPRLALGRFLRESGAVTAAMDLSDGLARDLPRLCRASGVSARLQAASLARYAESAIALGVPEILSGGEDYELLFTVSPSGWDRLRQEAEALPGGLPLGCLGAVGEGPAGTVEVQEGDACAPLPASGFDHFSA